MLKMRSLVLLTGATLGFANPANACPLEMMPNERIGMGYSLKIISASALVEITNAEYIRDNTEPEPLWRASTKIDKILLGKVPVTEINFEHGYNICDEIYALPKVGDKWVVYFSDRNDVFSVWNAYPASVARDAEAHLKLNGS